MPTPKLSTLALAALVTLSVAPGAFAASAPANNPQIFKDKGCVQCHKVSAYGIDGGETGPDLSSAFTDTKARFGMPLDKFLKHPTGTMQMVLGSMIKLNDKERAAMVSLLKDAGQKAAKK